VKPIAVMLAGATRTARSEGELQALLRALCRRNLAIMTANPRGFPPLTQTRVRYQREPVRTEDWQDAQQLLNSGRGDCEDIACYEAVRLFLSGVEARVILKRSSVGWHVLVWTPHGPYDPSKLLGM
jgi:hypothetical protein